MCSAKKRRKKLQAKMAKRGLDGAPAVVICVGKDCCDRALSKALVRLATTHAAATLVRVECVGCLHICEKGPVAATYPDVVFYKRVDGEQICALIDATARAHPRQA